MPKLLRTHINGVYKSLQGKSSCGIVEYRYELMQSTGLFDKNGQEIYEGDIIRMSLDGLRTFVCIYEKGGFQFQDLVHKTVCSNAGSYITHYIEIIGNVHENPGLLNQ